MEPADQPMQDDHDDEQQELDVDETPTFLDADDQAVEVAVDDENVPMQDEDDDLEEEEQEMQQPQEAVTDMSRVQFRSHTGPVFCVAAHVDSESIVVVSGGGDDRAYLHHVGTTATSTSTTAATAAAVPASKLLEHVHTDSVSSVALNVPYVTDASSNTPRMAAVGGYDGAILLYSTDTGEKLFALEGPTDVECLAFHPKGGSVLLAGSAADGTLWMYHVIMRKCLQVFVGHESAVNACQFSPDGKWALSASADGTLRVWAPRTGVCRHTFRFGPQHQGEQQAAGLTCMAVNGGREGQLVIVGAEDGQAHVCHIGTKKTICSLRHYDATAANQQQMQQDDDNDDDERMELPMSVEAVGFCSPTSAYPNWCCTGGVDGVLKIWDLTHDAQCRQACRHPVSQEEDSSETGGGITRCTWHPTLPFVVASYTNGLVTIWDARNGQAIQTRTGNTDVINDMSVQFLDHGSRVLIATGGEDQTVRLFEVDLSGVS